MTNHNGDAGNPIPRGRQAGIAAHVSNPSYGAVRIMAAAIFHRSFDLAD
jgi:hypothetical protein